MNENQFNSLLTLIVPQIIDKITENSNISDIDAIDRFYNSRLYSELSDEKSKLGTIVLCFSTQCIRTNC